MLSPLKQSEGYENLLNYGRTLGVVTLLVYTTAVFTAGYFMGHSNSAGVRQDANMNDRNNDVFSSGELPQEDILFHASKPLVGDGCAPCAEVVGVKQQAVQSAGSIDEVANLSQKSFACNTVKAFDGLTSYHEKVKRMEGAFIKNKNNQDRQRTETFQLKVLKAKEEEKSYRYCVQSMIPELLKLWDQKKQDGTLPNIGTISMPISVADLQQAAVELDPTARQETEQSKKMQSALRSLMNNLDPNNNGQPTAEQLQQLRSLHEQLSRQSIGRGSSRSRA